MRIGQVTWVDVGLYITRPDREAISTALRDRRINTVVVESLEQVIALQRYRPLWVIDDELLAEVKGAVSLGALILMGTRPGQEVSQLLLQGQVDMYLNLREHSAVCVARIEAVLRRYQMWRLADLWVRIDSPKRSRTA